MIHSITRGLLLAIAITFAISDVAVSQAADLTLNKLFSDHMVLQLGKEVPVWGWANAGDEITVMFAGQKVATTADTNGQWTATLEPLTASATPQTLKVASNAQDRLVKVEDVLVGEVWLGSGQSNMAMTVNRAQNFDSEKAAADLPLIRVFTERSIAAKTPNTDAKGDWSICSPDTVGGYSATAYFMGRELHKQLDVPVGIIVSAVGGTPIENWIDAEKQKAVPELEELTTALMNANAKFDSAAMKAKFDKQVEAWKAKAAEAKKAGKAAPSKPRDPVASHRMKGGPGDLFNGKIAPLVPYAVRGMIWYQGEGNSRPGKSQLYVHHMPTLIKEWRALWDERLPFGMVQLPNYERDGEGWSEVQEAFLKTVRTVPDTGMAVTIDVGDPNDIHPKNKQAVGKRLAIWALGEVYGQDVADVMGPIPSGTQIDGSRVVVSFDHANSGLDARGGDLVGFEITDGSGSWHRANARIDGQTVIVSSPAVKSPTAVRYAWAANPKASLFNKAGLPASPFRTSE